MAVQVQLLLLQTAPCNIWLFKYSCYCCIQPPATYGCSSTVVTAVNNPLHHIAVLVQLLLL